MEEHIRQISSKLKEKQEQELALLVYSNKNNENGLAKQPILRRQKRAQQEAAKQEAAKNRGYKKNRATF